MVVIDANLLIYAYNIGSPFQDKASRWLAEVFASGVEVGIPMQAILAFIRISTNPKLSPHPVSVANAVSIVDSWLVRSQIGILGAHADHWRMFKILCDQTHITGDLLTDVHIAVLAIEHNATLYSADRDFARFPSLHWINPLAQ